MQVRRLKIIAKEFLRCPIMDINSPRPKPAEETVFSLPRFLEGLACTVGNRARQLFEIG